MKRTGFKFANLYKTKGLVPKMSLRGSGTTEAISGALKIKRLPRSLWSLAMTKAGFGIGSKVLPYILISTTFCFAQKSYKELTFPSLCEIKVPEVKEEKLSNGMKLYLIEDHRLPIIKVWALVGVRTLFDPAEKVGLARITGRVMRTGGTKNLSGDEIDERLEAVGASISGSIDEDYGEFNLWVLKENFEEIFPIYVDILRNPSFAEDKIELAKRELRDEIARRNEDPYDIALREYRKLIYGETSPYARTVEYSTIDNIKREDLIDFHKKYFHPNNIRLGIIGDFDTQEMLNRIERFFKDWKPEKIEFPKLPRVDYRYRFSLNLAHKSGLTQTTILMGHIGTILKNPDYPALRLMNEILGGGYGGRLFKNVRSTRGLAYMVYGWYGAECDHPGVFYLGIQTASDSTLPAIEAIKEEVERIMREEVTEEELKRAKDSYLNSFVFRFDRKEEILHRMMVYDYYGYPRDFLIRIKEKIEKVKKRDILRVARKYLHPDKLVVLVVGDSTELKSQLAHLGRVNIIDIYRAEKEEIPKATRDAERMAEEILRAVREKYGGEGKLKKIKNIIIKGGGILKIQGMDVPISGVSAIVFPDKVWQSTEMMGSKVIEVYIGREGWIKNPHSTQEVKGRSELPDPIFRNPINLLKNIENPDYTFQYIGEEDGLKVILAVYKGEQRINLFVNPLTHLISKTVYKGDTPEGPGEIESIFSDYREVEGILMPYKIKVKVRGEDFEDLEIEEIEVNGEISPEWFEK